MSILLGLFLFLGGLSLYLLPYLIAQHNHKKNATSILILNAFLGWTFLGWIVALAWAVAKD